MTTATPINHIAVLGAGVIGASWTALFLAAGKRVSVFDKAPDAEKNLREYVATAWDDMTALGLCQRGDPDNLVFVDTPEQAVSNADFVQESVPEQLSIKHALYQRIEHHLTSHCIVASSTSGMTLSELQQGWTNPKRLILGHPFNPPHLIPLVELLANQRTDGDVLPSCEAFYADLGKITIRVKREVPAHVANRLQAALWKEAISLVATGVASVEDVDKAVWSGPGLRWAAAGPHQLFHLGAGAGGLAEFCERYTHSFERWWDDLEDVTLDKATVALLVDGIKAANPQDDVSSAAKQRDQLIVKFLQARAACDKS